MAQSGGISGVAVAMVTAGAFLAYIGIQNVPVRRGLREILSGRLPEPTAPVRTPGSTGASGGMAGAAGFDANSAVAVVNLAKQQIGKPYVWGAWGPNSFDCSGLPSWIYKQLGIGSGGRFTTFTFASSSEFVTIPFAQRMPGDLVIWNRGTASGHMGIVATSDQMIHAPRTGLPVQVGPYGSSRSGVTTLVRRPASYASSGVASGSGAGAGGGGARQRGTVNRPNSGGGSNIPF